MIIQYSISGSEWKAITVAGQSGSCWLDEQNDGAGGGVNAVVWHGITEPTSAEKTKAKRVFTPTSNNDTMLITADSGSDVFYATCIGENDTAIISVDAVALV